MGDRACILFFDERGVSPTVYLHWHGSDVPAWLDLLRVRMTGRFGDAEYAAARFVGLCHERIPGNLSLGLQRNAFTLADVADPTRFRAASPGNAGFVVVDTRDFTWRAYDGYLATYHPTSQGEPS